MIINCGGGNLSRSAIVTGQIMKSPDPSLEFIAENWAKLTSLENAKYYDQMSAYVGATMK